MAEVTAALAVKLSQSFVLPPDCFIFKYKYVYASLQLRISNNGYGNNIFSYLHFIIVVLVYKTSQRNECR